MGCGASTENGTAVAAAAVGKDSKPLKPTPATGAGAASSGDKDKAAGAAAGAAKPRAITTVSASGTPPPNGVNAVGVTEPSASAAALPPGASRASDSTKPAAAAAALAGLARASDGTSGGARAAAGVSPLLGADKHTAAAVSSAPASGALSDRVNNNSPAAQNRTLGTVNTAALDLQQHSGVSGKAAAARKQPEFVLRGVMGSVFTSFGFDGDAMPFADFCVRVADLMSTTSLTDKHRAILRAHFTVRDDKVNASEVLSVLQREWVQPAANLTPQQIASGVGPIRDFNMWFNAHELRQKEAKAPCVLCETYLLCGRDVPALPLYHWSRSALVERVTQTLVAVSDPTPAPVSNFQQLLSMAHADSNGQGLGNGGGGGRLQPRRVAPTIVALCGRSGVGKTTVAVEAVQSPHVRRWFHGCVVWLNVRRRRAATGGGSASSSSAASSASSSNSSSSSSSGGGRAAGSGASSIASSSSTAATSLALLSCLAGHLHSLRRTSRAVRARMTANAAQAALWAATGGVGLNNATAMQAAAVGRSGSSSARVSGGVPPVPPLPLFGSGGSAPGAVEMPLGCTQQQWVEALTAASHRASADANAAMAALDALLHAGSGMSPAASTPPSSARGGNQSSHALDAIDPPPPEFFTSLADAQEYLCREFSPSTDGDDDDATPGINSALPSTAAAYYAPGGAVVLPSPQDSKGPGRSGGNTPAPPPPPPSSLARALVVLDDVWERRVVADVVRCCPPNIKFVLTTPLAPERVRDLHSHVQVVAVDDQMSEAECAGLAAVCFARPVSHIPRKRARELTALTSTRPMALSLAALAVSTYFTGAVAADGGGSADDHHWVDVLNRLKTQKRVVLGRTSGAPFDAELAYAVAHANHSVATASVGATGHAVSAAAAASSSDSGAAESDDDEGGGDDDDDSATGSAGGDGADDASWVSLCTSLAFSVRTLSADLLHYALDLAIFPEGVWIPECVLLRFWAKRVLPVAEAASGAAKKPGAASGSAASSGQAFKQRTAPQGDAFGFGASEDDDMKAPGGFGSGVAGARAAVNAAAAAAAAAASGSNNNSNTRVVELNVTQILSIVHTLLARNLLQRRVLQDNTVCYSVHDVVGTYLRQRAAAEGVELLRARHQCLLFSYESAIRRDLLASTGGHVWMSIANDGYILNHLVHHLLGARKLETVRRLMMLNINWLYYKTQTLGVDSVLADFHRYLTLRPDDDSVRAVAQALTRSAAHVLTKQPWQLVTQLYARLATGGQRALPPPPSSASTSLVTGVPGSGLGANHAASVYSIYDQEHDFYNRFLRPVGWIESLRPTLMPAAVPIDRPVEALLASFHSGNRTPASLTASSSSSSSAPVGSVSAVAVFDHARRIITGHTDGAVLIWNALSGARIGQLGSGGSSSSSSGGRRGEQAVPRGVVTGSRNSTNSGNGVIGHADEVAGILVFDGESRVLTWGCGDSGGCSLACWWLHDGTIHFRHDDSDVHGVVLLGSRDRATRALSWSCNAFGSTLLIVWDLFTGTKLRKLHQTDCRHTMFMPLRVRVPVPGSSSSPPRKKTVWKAASWSATDRTVMLWNLNLPDVKSTATSAGTDDGWGDHKTSSSHPTHMSITSVSPTVQQSAAAAAAVQVCCRFRAPFVVHAVTRWDRDTLAVSSREQLKLVHIGGTGAAAGAGDGEHEVGVKGVFSAKRGWVQCWANRVAPSSLARTAVYASAASAVSASATLVNTAQRVVTSAFDSATLHVWDVRTCFPPQQPEHVRQLRVAAAVKAAATAASASSASSSSSAKKPAAAAKPSASSGSASASLSASGSASKLPPAVKPRSMLPAVGSIGKSKKGSGGDDLGLNLDHIEKMISGEGDVDALFEAMDIGDGTGSGTTSSRRGKPRNKAKAAGGGGGGSGDDLLGEVDDVLESGSELAAERSAPKPDTLSASTRSNKRGDGSSAVAASDAAATAEDEGEPEDAVDKLDARVSCRVELKAGGARWEKGALGALFNHEQNRVVAWTHDGWIALWDLSASVLNKATAEAAAHNHNSGVGGPSLVPPTINASLLIKPHPDKPRGVQLMRGASLGHKLFSYSDQLLVVWDMQHNTVTKIKPHEHDIKHLMLLADDTRCLTWTDTTRHSLMLYGTGASSSSSSSSSAGSSSLLLGVPAPTHGHDPDEDGSLISARHTDGAGGGGGGGGSGSHAHTEPLFKLWNLNYREPGFQAPRTGMSAAETDILKSSSSGTAATTKTSSLPAIAGAQSAASAASSVYADALRIEYTQLYTLQQLNHTPPPPAAAAQQAAAQARSAAIASASAAGSTVSAVPAAKAGAHVWVHLFEAGTRALTWCRDGSVLAWDLLGPPTPPPFNSYNNNSSNSNSAGNSAAALVALTNSGPHLGPGLANRGTEAADCVPVYCTARGPVHEVTLAKPTADHTLLATGLGASTALYVWDLAQLTALLDLRRQPGGAAAAAAIGATKARRPAGSAGSDGGGGGGGSDFDPNTILGASVALLGHTSDVLGCQWITVTEASATHSTATGALQLKLSHLEDVNALLDNPFPPAPLSPHSKAIQEREEAKQLADQRLAALSGGVSGGANSPLHSGKDYSTPVSPLAAAMVAAASEQHPQHRGGQYSGAFGFGSTNTQPGSQQRQQQQQQLLQQKAKEAAAAAAVAAANATTCRLVSWSKKEIIVWSIGFHRSANIDAAKKRNAQRALLAAANSGALHAAAGSGGDAALASPPHSAALAAAGARRTALGGGDSKQWPPLRGGGPKHRANASSASSAGGLTPPEFEDDNEPGSAAGAAGSAASAVSAPQAMAPTFVIDALLKLDNTTPWFAPPTAATTAAAALAAATRSPSLAATHRFGGVRAFDDGSHVLVWTNHRAVLFDLMSVTLVQQLQAIQQQQQQQQQQNGYGGGSHHHHHHHHQAAQSQFLYLVADGEWAGAELYANDRRAVLWTSVAPGAAAAGATSPTAKASAGKPAAAAANAKSAEPAAASSSFCAPADGRLYVWDLQAALIQQKQMRQAASSSAKQTFGLPPARSDAAQPVNATQSAVTSLLTASRKAAAADKLEREQKERDRERERERERDREKAALDRAVSSNTVSKAARRPYSNPRGLEHLDLYDWSTSADTNNPATATPSALHSSSDGGDLLLPDSAKGTNTNRSPPESARAVRGGRGSGRHTDHSPGRLSGFPTAAASYHHTRDDDDAPIGHGSSPEKPDRPDAGPAAAAAPAREPLRPIVPAPLLPGQPSAPHFPEPVSGVLFYDNGRFMVSWDNGGSTTGASAPTSGAVGGGFGSAGGAAPVGGAGGRLVVWDMSATIQFSILTEHDVRPFGVSWVPLFHSLTRRSTDTPSTVARAKPKSRYGMIGVGAEPTLRGVPTLVLLPTGGYGGGSGGGDNQRLVCCSYDASFSVWSGFGKQMRDNLANNVIHAKMGPDASLQSLQPSYPHLHVVTCQTFGSGGGGGNGGGAAFPHVNGVVLFADGHRALCWDQGVFDARRGQLTLWDVPNATKLRALPGHSARVQGVTLLGCGVIGASAAWNSTSGVATAPAAANAGAFGGGNSITTQTLLHAPHSALSWSDDSVQLWDLKTLDSPDATPLWSYSADAKILSCDVFEDERGVLQTVALTHARNALSVFRRPFGAARY